MGDFVTLFSTPPVLVKYFDKDIDALVTCADKLEYYKSYTNSSSRNTFILNEIEFLDLKNFIEKSIVEYTIKIFNTDHRFALTQSWITKNNSEERQEIHTHPGSILSGVFYLKCPKNSGDIEFNRGRAPFDIQINKDCSNQFVSDRYTIPAETGKLLLFPSNVLHSVYPNKSSETRYSLAFNSFPTLPIGHIDSLTYLY